MNQSTQTTSPKGFVTNQSSRASDSFVQSLTKADVLSATDKPDSPFVDFGLIPLELRESPHWVIWEWRLNERSSKWSKPPVDSHTGRCCDALDSANWLTFDKATSAYLVIDSVSGIGVVLGESGLTCIDIDGCRNSQTGKLSALAESIIDELQSYTEVSPSGTGIKIFVYGDLQPSHKTRNLDGTIEIYDNHRYVTVTGERIRGFARVEDRAEALQKVWQEHVGKGSSTLTEIATPADAGLKDGSTSIQNAVSAMHRATEGIHDNNDGSLRMIVCLNRAVDYTLTHDESILAFREYEIARPFPVAFDDSRLRKELNRIESKRQKPTVILPGHSQTITNAARELGELLNSRRTHFVRGGEVVRVRVEKERVSLQLVKAAELMSDIENVAELRKLNSKGVSAPAICTKSTADSILSCQAYKNSLPKLSAIYACPVLDQSSGKLRIISGYDEPTGILAKGDPPEEMKVSEAVELLKGDVPSIVKTRPHS